MADKMQITIIGMDLLGTSAGLALRRFSEKATIVGHDRNLGKAGQAKKQGAIDRMEWNLINAITGADRILLALPASEIRDTLAAIREDLKPGCVLVDTADVKGPVMAWAAELLPPNVHFVGGHPVMVVEDLNQTAARADLFKDKFFCLTVNPDTGDAGLRLGADLVEALGAKAFFLDPVEHDGIMAAVEHMPMLAAAAMMGIVSSNPAWGDMRKLAGSQFYSSTLVTATDGRAVALAAAANRENTLRWLDTLIAELEDWRQQLAAGQEEELAKTIDKGLEAGQRWQGALTSGNWDEVPQADIVTTGGYMRQLIGFGGMRTPAEKGKRK